MLAGAPDFAAQTNSNKVFSAPRAEVKGSRGQRLVTEWEDCHRVWGNERCPCFHSDPKLPDCEPGQTVRREGRLWFES